MKTLNSFLSLLLILCISSCAHKSGHNKQNVNQRNSKRQSGVSNYNKEKVDDKLDLDVIETQNQGNKNRFQGSEIFLRYNTAVFMIYTSDGYNVYQGSGFFINSKGLAVSNYHVFQGTNIGEEGIKLAGNEKMFKVTEVIKTSEDEDFILFQVNASNTNYIPLAKFKPQVGEKVYTIGSPLGLENTFSSGEISQWRDKNLMQISALIDHGSSGGALINEYGEAVGITSGSFADGSQANLNYAWSIEVIKPYIK